MKKGDLITVVDFRHTMLKRHVVEISGDTLYLCTDEELALASKLGREPIVVGFNRQFVVTDESR